MAHGGIPRRSAYNPAFAQSTRKNHMSSPALDHDAIIAATAHWVDKAVIGLNLCPFAKAVQVKKQIRYVVSDATTPEQLLEQLIAELGQRQSAGGAQHQALAQLVFEHRYPARYRGFGQADPLGGTAEAAGFGDTGEDQQVIGFILFHIRNNDTRFKGFSLSF